MRYYLPTWNGDFRILPDEGRPETHSLLIVRGPTAAEKEALRRFAARAGGEGWIAKAEVAAVPEPGTKQVCAPLWRVGALLADLLGFAVQGTLTAVAFEHGRLQVTEEVDQKKLAKWLQKATKRGAHAAVTSRPPTKGCPACTGKPELDRAACDALWDFLDDEQREEWLAAPRAFTSFGGTTGNAYRLVARDTEAARLFERSIWSLDGKHAVCAYDWTVPPEEELLGLKLRIEHRELPFAWGRISSSDVR